MLQVAVFELAVPVGRATALQPLSVVLSTLKSTLPVGALPVTVAVKVTFAPKADGLAELARLVVLAVLLLTTCDKACSAGACVGGITGVATRRRCGHRR